MSKIFTIDIFIKIIYNINCPSKIRYIEFERIL